MALGRRCTRNILGSKASAHWEEDVDMDAFDRIEGNKLLRIRFLDCVDKYPTEISRRAYYRAAQSAIVVYAVDDRNSYTAACEKWVQEVEAYCWEKGRAGTVTLQEVNRDMHWGPSLVTAKAMKLLYVAC